ncbi:unnamed protein product [Clonostachys solani]|uniref:Uncharacterized protein n=1 Tax=Clonostachys solani TaxID=160281 RepID=A0A9P0EPK3_9HYPO|nr:unnamed protein product [Clonostachys solani]
MSSATRTALVVRLGLAVRQPSVWSLLVGGYSQIQIDGRGGHGSEGVGPLRAQLWIRQAGEDRPGTVSLVWGGEQEVEVAMGEGP